MLGLILCGGKCQYVNRYTDIRVAQEICRMDISNPVLTTLLRNNSG